MGPDQLNTVARPEAFQVGGAVEAEDVGHFRHGDIHLVLQVSHEFVDDDLDVVEGIGGQVEIEDGAVSSVRTSAWARTTGSLRSRLMRSRSRVDEGCRRV